MNCVLPRLVAYSIISGAAFSVTAVAEVADDASTSGVSGKGDQLQEIVVTAQKRSQNINDVGMAITASSALQLQERGITDVSQLTKLEPSLQYSQAQSGTPVYTLRGVGYFEQSLSASPTVSIYQDEVAFPFPVMSRGVLLDPERVEILKGPQGTLYGQNATGGAINFIAAKPTDTFTAGFDDSYSRFNDNLVSGFISGPLSPTLKARLSGSLEEGGAWQKSVTRDDTLGNKDTKIARLILDWVPTDNFTASLNANGWWDHSETQAGQLEGFRFQDPQNVGVGSSANPAFYRPAPAGSAAFAAYPGPIQSLLAEPIAPNDPRAADWGVGTHPHNNESFYQASLRLDYSFLENLGVTSISNYERYTELNTIDPTSNALIANQTALISGGVTTVAQEFRLHGSFNDNAGNWLIGVNYERDKSSEIDGITTIGSVSYSPVPLGLPPYFGFGANNNDLSTTKSVFANAEYHVIPSVNLHAGIRYTKSDQDLNGCSTSTYPSVNILQTAVSGELAGLAGGVGGVGIPGQCVTLGPAPNFLPSNIYNTLDQSNVPWRVGVDFTPIERTLLYVTVSKGFKAGSSPALGASNYDQLTPVTQESLLAYEAGVKSELFDRSLQIDLSIFHYDYTNKQELGRLQDPVYGAVQTLINIPKSKEDGAEFSATLRPLTGVTLNAAATYLDSKVTSNYFNTGPYPLGPTDEINFKGEPFPFAPKWSMQAGARYDWSIFSNMAAFLSADGSYQTHSSAAFGSNVAAAEDAPSLTLPSYGLLNLTAGIGPSDHKWQVQLFGKNVTNKYYWNSVNYIADSVDRLAGMPVTYGVRFSYRY